MKTSSRNRLSAAFSVLFLLFGVLDARADSGPEVVIYSADGEDNFTEPYGASNEKQCENQ